MPDRPARERGISTRQVLKMIEVGARQAKWLSFLVQHDHRAAQ